MPHAQIRTSYDLGPEGRFVVVELDDGANTSVPVQPPNVQIASKTFVLIDGAQDENGTDVTCSSTALRMRTAPT